MIANGHISEARNLVNEASVENDRVFGTPIRALEAKLDLDAGNAERALKIAEHVIAEISGYQEGSMRASTWLLAIQALRSMHRNDEAIVEVARLVAFAKGSDIPDVRVFARLAEAESAWSERRRDEAMRLHDDALRQANATGIPATVADVAVSYGNALIDDGDLAGAAAVAGQVARWATGISSARCCRLAYITRSASASRGMSLWTAPARWRANARYLRRSSRRRRTH